MSLLFNTLSRLVIAFLPRSKHLLTSWLQSPSAVFSQPKKIKSVTVYIVSFMYLPWSDAMILVFWILSCMPALSFSSLTFIKRLFRSSSLSVMRVISAAAAKSFQSCPTLCGPIDGSPASFPVPGTLQARILGVGCHFLLQCTKVKLRLKSFSHVRLWATAWTAAYQAPSSMGFSRQGYWSGLPLTPPS